MIHAWVAMAALIFFACAPAQPMETGGALRSDNTQNNLRDKKGDTLTALDQSEDLKDLQITGLIRKAITSDDSFSTLADNIKIITINGVVTLRGPVHNRGEKDSIQKKSEMIAGADYIDNQLEVIVQ